MSPIQILAYLYFIGSVLVFFLACLISWKSIRIECRFQIVFCVKFSKFVILALTATLLCYFIVCYFQSRNIIMPPVDKYGPFGVLTHIKLQICFLVLAGASIFSREILIRLLSTDISPTETSCTINRTVKVVYIFIGLLCGAIIAIYLIGLHYSQVQSLAFQYFVVFVYLIILNGFSVLIFCKRM